jgi:hypothetical protein
MTPQDHASNSPSRADLTKSVREGIDQMQQEIARFLADCSGSRAEQARQDAQKRLSATEERAKDLNRIFNESRAAIERAAQTREAAQRALKSKLQAEADSIREQVERIADDARQAIAGFAADRTANAAVVVDSARSFADENAYTVQSMLREAGKQRRQAFADDSKRRAEELRSLRESVQSLLGRAPAQQTLAKSAKSPRKPRKKRSTTDLSSPAPVEAPPKDAAKSSRNTQKRSKKSSRKQSTASEPTPPASEKLAGRESNAPQQLTAADILREAKEKARAARERAEANARS